MPATHLIFEDTSSALYYSNDGRLRLHVENPFHPTKTVFTLRLFSYEDDADAYDTVFATRDRVKVDAYIAGYDLARS